MKKFSENLKIARTIKGLNQIQLSEKMEMSQAAICLFERGERFPKRKTLEKFCDVLDIPIEELVGNSECCIGQAHLNQEIKGLSIDSIYKLIEYAEFLKYKEDYTKNRDNIRDIVE